MGNTFIKQPTHGSPYPVRKYQCACLLSHPCSDMAKPFSAPGLAILIQGSFLLSMCLFVNADYQNTVLQTEFEEVSISVNNPSFEEDPHSYHSLSVEAGPSGWEVKAGGCDGCVLAKNSNAPWGHLDSGYGEYYLVLQRKGWYVEQTLQGLTAGEWYRVKFSASARPHARTEGMDERVRVTVDGSALFDTNLPDGFRTYFIDFKATGATAVLRFENNSPDPVEDLSVFVDNVEVVQIIFVANPSFEDDPHSYDYLYVEAGPSGWEVRDGGDDGTSGSKGYVIAKNGNAPWGGLNSGDGNFYLVLQRQRWQVKQTLEGLTAGEWYRVKFSASARPHAPTAGMPE
eukprot:2011147-Rhodomonas_salina.1